MPEQALSVVSMINDLVSLIKEPLLLANAGVVLKHPLISHT